MLKRNLIQKVIVNDGEARICKKVVMEFIRYKGHLCGNYPCQFLPLLCHLCGWSAQWAMLI